MYVFRITILVVMFLSGLIAQDSKIDSSAYYNKGVTALEKKEFESAESYFEKSIEEYEDGPSYYQLALLNLKKDTPVFREKALKLLKKSVWKEPENIAYRTALAELLEDFAKYNAVLQYEKILELDGTSTIAWAKLGDIKRKEFDEYYNSVRRMSDEIESPLDEYALEDFEKAEYYYKKALDTDPENIDVILDLALLYERKDSLDASIYYLKKLVDINPASKAGRLYLGVCYNITGKYKNAHDEFVKAVALMTPGEKYDFTTASVLELINPVFENLAEVKNKKYLNNVISAYWKISDPLFDETVNERLLEHYTRVAYADLRVTPEDKSISGWKTDMGKTVLRYGIPLKRKRYRPSMEDFGVMMKTEVWDYDDMAFGFTDQFMSGKYAYSAPMGDKSHFTSQFAGDSHTYAQQLKNIRYQIYKPPFRNERFDLDYDISQFKDYDNQGHTDFLITYSYLGGDSLGNRVSEKYNHKWSMNFFNSYYENTCSDKGRLEYTQPSDTLIKSALVENSLVEKLKPDSGIVSFKIYREYDKGFSSFIDRFKVKEFSGNKLMISDLIFASDISEKREADGIHRGEITIYPAVAKINHKQNIYLYYEIYNLEKAGTGLTDFVVELKIKSESGGGLKGLLSSIAGSVGLKDDNSITMTSSYQTAEKDPQIFFQLNLSELTEGNYSVEINVNDNVANSSAASLKSFSITDNTL